MPENILRKLLTWYISGVREEIPDYDDLMQGELNQIAYHFSKYYEHSECKKGFHNWSDWNSHSTGIQSGQIPISLRVCKKCGLEMPDSRKGDKNYRTYNQWLDKIEENRVKDKEYEKQQQDLFIKKLKETDLKEILRKILK